MGTNKDELLLESKQILKNTWRWKKTRQLFRFFFADKYNSGNYGDGASKNMKGGGEEGETRYGAKPKVRPPSKENMMEKLAALDKLGFSSSK
jgi:hypothetical protein